MATTELCIGTFAREDYCCWHGIDGLCSELAVYEVVYMKTWCDNTCVTVQHHYCIQHAAIARQNPKLFTCKTLEH